MIAKFQILKRDDNRTRINVETRDMVRNLEWVTDLDYSAGELTFGIMSGKDPIIPAMGAIADFAWDGKDILQGFIFSTECTSDTTVSAGAYDFERYLRSEESVVFQSGTFGDRYSNVCRRFGVPFHIKKRPTYRVPTEVCDGKTGFDMIEGTINKTYSVTGEMYYIVANHMYIGLRGTPIPTRTLLVIDTQNTMSDYTYLEGIDNAANIVQIAQKNTDNSQTRTATATPDTGDDPTTTGFTIASTRGNTVRAQGQVVRVVNAKNRANWAQMVQQANDELKKRNISEKKLTLDRIGDTSLITGAGANVRIKDFDKTRTNCLILRATHNFEINYTCSLEVKVDTEWQENSL